ncbi:hypothetical protein M0805_002638 [Coniferiporia weirii]|nr:hypothetical protein M0805_002638 [Coniferiporia weirii]
MLAQRPSQGAEAARIAAAQAEFNEKKWVWVPDDKEGYMAGWVIREEGDLGEVVMASGGETRRLPLYALSKMNPPKFDRVDDIADLTFLNEASVVHNLRLRYGSGAIYTYSSLFLVAINPYQNLPLYTDAIVQQYRNKRRDENPPHIFAVAERAWVNMGEERENQSILITGESGAGKTENTKKVIQYLASIATDVHASHTRSPSVMSASSSFNSGVPRSQSANRKSLVGGSQLPLTAKGRLGLLERQILQANPILEAFGNAQTQRNNNSSRFGKFIRISFAPDGSIAGANVDWYLLEKSRVVIRSEAERSFHVFYQLMEAETELKQQLLLDGDVADYEYLNKSRREVDGVDDKEEWRQLKNAMEVVGLTATEQFDLFRIVAAILHIGNITITATRADDALMPDVSQAERVCHLLGIPVSEFTKAVLRPRVLAGREWVPQARTRQQALDELSALCKTLYEKSFGALVDRINRALDRPSSKSTFIGVLDIAGFEIFETNAYEQLLINYTNERLQQFFNHHMFELEQEEYARESIEWEYFDFGLDLQPTIELIESSGATIGILSCLDEECIMPKATDSTFTQKLHQLWGGDPPYGEKPHPGREKYTPARFEQGFIVKHYAGDVEYRTEGWLEKNKDPLNDNLTRVLAASDEQYIAGLFSDYAEASANSIVGGISGSIGKKRTVKKGAFRTVAQRHREQLASLINQLKATQPHFVRCIVPNGNKKAGRVDVPLVLDQLRCNGVLEGIRIARLGYPNRLPFVEFRQRYESLTPGIIPKGYMDGRKACLRMVDALELDKAIYRIGTSKIFFKAGVLADLEERRDALLFDIFSRLQATARMWTARRQMKKVLNRAVAIRTIQRNARVYGELREWPWWQLYTKVRPLLTATRNDEELRKKEVELALIKERAEREQREKEALESLKMKLEADKRKVEEDLEAERALGLDKDALLERSKKHETELEEDVAALQADLDTLDSQLDRVMANHKATEEKYEALREAFDEAASHLVRFEEEQKSWKIREEELSQSLKITEEKLESLQAERDELEKVSEDSRRLLGDREEDLVRARERMESVIADLEMKLASEVRNRQFRDLGKTRTDALEQEARQAKEQLTEMARTATEYSTLITKKEADIARVAADLDNLSSERDKALKHIAELQGQAETSQAQLDAQEADNVRSTEAQARLQKEMDELRTLMQAKTSEETRRREVEKSKENELLELRSQLSQLQSELSESRKVSVESQNRLKVDLEAALRENASLQRDYQHLVESEKANQSRRKEIDSALSDADRAKRMLESELQAAKSRQSDIEGQCAEATKAKEMLERQLTSAQVKVEDYEEAVIQLEREKSNWVRQMDQTRQQLDDEKTKRQQLEKHASTQRAEIIKLKDRTIKLDRELNKALDNLKAREWEVKQLESRQDKTIVEHVHVLEEAKRVTDRQLAEAQAELQKNASYIRSLEKSKARLASEAEDLSREAELETRARDKEVRLHEEKASRAMAEAFNAKRAKETAEIQARRSQTELQNAKDQLAFLEQQLATVQHSKSTLEAELTTLADETETPNSMTKVRREYESRIAKLQNELEDSETAQVTANRIKDIVERQHAEIRKLVLSSGPQDDAFRTRLLQELQQTENGLYRELGNRSQQYRDMGASGTRSVMNTPTKATNKPTNGVIRGGKDLPAPPKTPDRQVDRLKQQVQVLELQMAASERVRRHLEASLKDMTAELESLDGSKHSLQSYKARLTKENTRLSELLNEEAQARRATEANHLDGLQSMWDKFQSTMAEERESYSRLEESRRALLVQQRNAQADLELQRRQNQELTQAKVKLQAELTNLQDKVEREKLAKSEESNAKRKLLTELQEVKVSSAASSVKHSELAEAVKAYRAKAENYLTRLEQAEIEKAKATNGEAFARKALDDLEKAHTQALKERKAAEERAAKSEQNLRDLSSKLAHGDRQSSDLEQGRQRLEEELQEERDRHVADLAERDFAMSQTQITYQTKLAELSDELQSQRDNMSRLREENRKLRSDYDELQLQYDDEVYNGGAWKKEKERLETKISDITNAYESSTAARTEQQSQIVALHSQVRELRGVLEDAEAERVMLQKARRALQSQLDGIKLDNIDPDKMSAESKLQDLQLKKQDLERALEEHQDRVMMAEERMKKAEVHAQECQMELGEIRVENSELDRKNANLEKQAKELNVRIVDLETKAYANASRLKGEALRQTRTGDRPSSGARNPPADSERMRSRLEEEVKSYEAKIADMREAMAELSTKEGNLQIAKRKAEREAGDYKQRVLSLEREVERLRSRLERPASVLQSPAGSPRKFGS